MAISETKACIILVLNHGHTFRTGTLINYIKFFGKRKKKKKKKNVY